MLIGLLGWFVYLIMLVELVGGLVLFVGFCVCIVVLVLLLFMFGVVVVYLLNGWSFVLLNGGWEYLVFWVVMLVV